MGDSGTVMSHAGTRDRNPECTLRAFLPHVYTYIHRADMQKPISVTRHASEPCSVIPPHQEPYPMPRCCRTPSRAKQAVAVMYAAPHQPRGFMQVTPWVSQADKATHLRSSVNSKSADEAAVCSPSAPPPSPTPPPPLSTNPSYSPRVQRSCTFSELRTAAETREAWGVQGTECVGLKVQGLGCQQGGTSCPGLAYVELSTAASLRTAVTVGRSNICSDDTWKHPWTEHQRHAFCGWELVLRAVKHLGPPMTGVRVHAPPPREAWYDAPCVHQWCGGSCAAESPLPGDMSVASCTWSPDCCFMYVAPTCTNV